MNTALDVMYGTVISLPEVNYEELLCEYTNINDLYGVNCIKLTSSHLQKLRNNCKLLVHNDECVTTIELSNRVTRDLTKVKWDLVGNTYYCNVGGVVIKLIYLYDKGRTYEPTEFKVVAAISSSTNNFQQVIGRCDKMSVDKAKVAALSAVIVECERLQETSSNILDVLTN